MACSGGSTASRGWWRGRYGGGGGSGRRREVGALGGGDVDGGGARLARWGEQDDGVRSGLWAAATSMAAVLDSRGGGSRPDGPAAPGADEKPSVRGKGERRRKEIYGGAFCPG